MNKTTFLLGIMMGILVLFAGCTSFNPYRQGGQNDAPQAESATAQNESSPSQTAPAEEIPEQQADYSIAGQIERCGGDNTCLTAVALEYESPAICEGLATEYRQHTCYEQLAVKYKNAGYCNEINEYAYRYAHNQCTDALNAALASQTTATGTAGVGSTTAGADAQRNYTIPEQIEMCGGEDSCLAALALNYEIPTLCDEIGSATSQQACYRQLAIRYGKAGYCDALYAFDQDDCTEAVAASSTAETGSSYDAREYTIAEQTEMCRAMAPWDEIGCLKAIALDNEIPTICGELNPLDQYDCYEEMAIRYDKPQYCQMINDLVNRGTCERMFG